MARIAQNTPTDKVILPANVPRLKRAWSCTTGASSEFSPIVVGDVVSISSTDHNLYALEARTGALLWSYTTGGGILSSPAEADGMVYVGHRDHTLYALDNPCGCRGWLGESQRVSFFQHQE